MFVITFKGKPATVAKIYSLEKNDDWSLHSEERTQCLAAPTKRKAIALYLYYVGSTWKERRKGIEVSPAKIAVPATKKK